jgi:hypothetical protein
MNLNQDTGTLAPFVPPLTLSLSKGVEGWTAQNISRQNCGGINRCNYIFYGKHISRSNKKPFVLSVSKETNG